MLTQETIEGQEGTKETLDKGLPVTEGTIEAVKYTAGMPLETHAPVPLTVSAVNVVDAHNNSMDG